MNEGLLIDSLTLIANCWPQEHVCFAICGQNGVWVCAHLSVVSVVWAPEWG